MKERTGELGEQDLITPHIQNEYSTLIKVLVNTNPEVVTSNPNIVGNPIQRRAVEQMENKTEIKVYPGAERSHANLLEILSQNNVEIVFSNIKPILVGHTPLFTRDVGVIIDNLVVPSSMRYEYRSVEVAGLLKHIEKERIVKTNNDYKLEGGDIMFLESNLILVGIGPRTDTNGLKLLQSTFPDKEFIPFSIVKEEEAFHIDTNLGILGNKHMVYLPELVPHSIVKMLIERGYSFVEADMSEHDSCCTNILAINDRKIIASAENKITNQRIRESGTEVLEVSLKDILTFGGGAHCLTLPLVRL